MGQSYAMHMLNVLIFGPSHPKNNHNQFMDSPKFNLTSIHNLHPTLPGPLNSSFI